MALFLDTSALIKLFVPEEGSDDVLRLCDPEEVIHISGLTHHEFISGLARKRQDKELNVSEVVELTGEFRRMLDIGEFQVIALGDTVMNRALALIESRGVQGLRTLDAIQLASCLEVRDVTMVAADRVLAGIAELESVRIIVVG